MESMVAPLAKKYNQKKVFIVEDNPLNAKLFRDILAQIGFECSESANGVEAVERITEMIPDFVVMDIQIHGITGLEAIRRLKSNSKTKDIPILAVTAFALEGDEEGIYEAGCDAYMSKPISVTAFLDQIDQLMRKK